jgi:mannosyltransferase OCH1-like enzyme
MMVPIPKIIHQIWIQGKNKMPLRYRFQGQTWQKHNPSWEYCIWDDDSLKTLIHDHYRELLPVYEAYEPVVARADIGRYAVLHRFGGLYVDTDTTCVRSIDRYLVEPNVSLYVQVYDNPSWEVDPDKLVESVSNAFIACIPGHEIWQRVFRYFKEFEHPQPVWILATGPDMYIECLKQYRSDHEDVHFFTRDRIVTAYYLSRHYLRWYAWKNPDIFAIHYNDSARLAWKPSLRDWLWPDT